MKILTDGNKKFNSDSSLIFPNCNCVIQTADGATTCNSRNTYDFTVSGSNKAQMSQKQAVN